MSAATRGRAGLVLGVAVATLAGCTADGLAGVPLPGGAAGGPAYRITVEFADVLDLVPQSAVKVNDVTVGSVEKIWLSGWTARVQVRVDRKVRLPDNATAAIRQTSLLGEKFVALAAPIAEPGRGELSDGDVIPLARTGRASEVEEVLSALGLVLNGSGLAHLKTINQELAGAVEGRERDVRDMLRQLDSFIGGLDEQKADIVRAIDALDRLTVRLAAQRGTVGAAVDAFAPGLRVLAEQRQQLTAALTALGALSAVGSRVINASRDDTLASLRALRPLLDQLVRAGDNLPRALDFLMSYPFPPNITGAIVGDAINLEITLDLDAAAILANLLVAAPPPAEAPAPQTPQPELPLPQLPLPELPLPTPALPGLPLPTPTLPPLLPSLPPLLPGLPGLTQMDTGLAIAPGAAPLGAVEGHHGGLAELLNGGLLR
ncbi:MAG TPA: MCE family protein [Micromonosporaceae bacterium]|nr:MCE family protein [Micromonosporaceae bacterium]